MAPTEFAVLREMLNSPHQWVRYTALDVAAAHRHPALTPDILGYARAMHMEDNYTHWSAALKALKAIGRRRGD